MNKKLVISLVLIGVLAFGAGLGSYAWFTSTTSSQNNVFDTGVLQLNGGNVSTAAFMNFQNKQPGDSESATLLIQNTGDLSFRYRVYVETFGGDSVLYNNPNGADRNLQVSIHNSDSSVTWNGALKDLLVGNPFEDLLLAAGTNDTLTFTVSLPTAAGNECQGATCNMTFRIDATQTANNTYAQ